MFYGRYQEQKSVPIATDLALACRLWNDDDLKCFKMDEKCNPSMNAHESMNTFDDN